MFCLFVCLCLFALFKLLEWEQREEIEWIKGNVLIFSLSLFLFRGYFSPDKWLLCLRVALIRAVVFKGSPEKGCWV